MKKRKILVGLAAGIATGGMLVAAFATDKGKETRKKFNHFVKQFSNKFEFSKHNLKQKFEKGEQKAEDIKHDLKPGSKDPIANSVSVKKDSSEVH